MSQSYPPPPPGGGGGAIDNRPPGATAAPNIAVTDLTQLETFKPGADGRPVQGFDISFTTPSGTRATVFVPLSRYTLVNVQAAIQDKAGTVESVHKLAQ